MFTYRQLLIVAAISSVSQILFHILFKPNFEIDYLGGLVIGHFTLVINVWLLEVFGVFKDFTPNKEVKND